MKRSAAACAGLVLVCALQSGGVRAQQPTFRSGVEVTAIDVTVVDNDGNAITDIKPGEIRVRIDGKDRRVTSAQWIASARPSVTSPAVAPPKPPDGYSTNQDSAKGRLIVIAVDQPNLRPDHAMDVRNALNDFIDGMEPGDRAAAVALGGGGSTAFTSDRAAVKTALSRMSGRMRPLSDMSQYVIGMSEARDIVDLSATDVGGARPNGTVLETVYQRECVDAGLPADLLPVCREQIKSNSFAIATSRQNEADETMQSLRTLLGSLQKVDGPKTVVMVSEGFDSKDKEASIVELGSIAAAAQTTLYVLKLDSQSLDMSVSRSVSKGSGTFNAAGERQMRYSGVELLASVSKGEVFDVIGTGKPAVARVARELAGYYLVGVESEPADTDGKAHPISVSVSRRGSIVRSRRELAHATAAKAGELTPNEEVSAALSSPLVSAGLPIRVATFALRDPKDSRVQVLIHADVGSDYAEAKSVTLGYAVVDTKGTVVANQLGNGRLPTAVNGAPAPLTYSTSVTLDPGDYTLKFAVLEGDRVGSVEHQFHAGFIDAGPLKVSELMIGGPVDARLILAPTVGYEVRYGTVQGYIEAYGPTANAMTVKYEIAPGLNSPSLFGAVVPGRAEGDDRMVFSYAMPVKDLKPGQYFLRASLSANGKVVKGVARAFRVEPAPASAATSTTQTRSLTLSVGDEVFIPRFSRDDVTRQETVQRFRQTVPSSATAAFDSGTRLLASGDTTAAETSFRGALDVVPAGADNTAALAYLGATYAASGHDEEAVGIWQAALIDGAGFPQLYQWTSDALIRMGKADEARPMLEEALTKWPGETGFAKPLAMMFAKSGRGREGIALLRQYLADHPTDMDSLMLGVQWMADVHAAGVLVFGQAEDVKMAQAWADAYTIANGPRTDDVKRWMLSLQSSSSPGSPATPANRF